MPFSWVYFLAVTVSPIIYDMYMACRREDKKTGGARRGAQAKPTFWFFWGGNQRGLWDYDSIQSLACDGTDTLGEGKRAGNRGGEGMGVKQQQPRLAALCKDGFLVASWLAGFDVFRRWRVTEAEQE